FFSARPTGVQRLVLSEEARRASAVSGSRREHELTNQSVLCKVSVRREPSAQRIGAGGPLHVSGAIEQVPERHRRERCTFVFGVTGRHLTQELNRPARTPSETRNVGEGHQIISAAFGGQAAQLAGLVERLESFRVF